MSSGGSDGPVAGAAPADIYELVRRFPVLAPPVSTAGAAVVIVLRKGDDEVETLLIERAERPNDPGSGQVGLPGGHVDDGDGSLATTAFRELEEEVGLREDDLVGDLRYVTTELAVRFDLKVAVFTGMLGPDGPQPKIASAEEVAHVFWLPRSALGTSRPIVRETSRGFAEVRATTFEGHLIWGFTRRVLCRFFGIDNRDEAIGPIFVPRADEPH